MRGALIPPERTGGDAGGRIERLVRAYLPRFSPGLILLAAPDSRVRVRPRPESFLPGRPSQLAVVARLGEGRQLLAGPRLPDVRTPDARPGDGLRVPPQERVPAWGVRPDRAGHRPVRRIRVADPRRPAADAVVLRRRCRRGLAVAAPAVRPVGRAGGGAALLLVLVRPVLQRHDLQRWAEPVRGAAGLSRHGRVRSGGPLPASGRQVLRGAAAGLAGVRPAAGVHRVRRSGCASTAHAVGQPAGGGPRRGGDTVRPACDAWRRDAPVRHARAGIQPRQ